MVQISAGRLTRAQRARIRARIQLDDAALTPKTQSRYYIALRKLVPVVEKVRAEEQLDASVCDWIRAMWVSGEPLLTIGDALSALQFHQPWTKRKLVHSWKLFSVWRKVEVPTRAPPLTQRIIRSMAAYAIAQNRWGFAMVLILGFECLLRTGELLNLYPRDLLAGRSSGICTLRETKSGKRTGSNEFVSITDPVALELVKQFLQLRRELNLTTLPVWTASATAFRRQFAQICSIFDLQRHSFRPYSLRRGGATHAFQVSQSMEFVLARGRWSSGRVARIYISDGLSYLPSIKLSDRSAALLKQYYFNDPING